MNNMVTEIQDAIDELLIYEDDKKDKIKSDKRVKYIVAYITGAMSYANGVKILMKEKQYDSVLPLCRAFLEMYAPICYMIENFNDVTEFDNYLKKLIVIDMMQNKKMYNSLKNDITITDEEERESILKEIISFWETRIINYFSDKSGNIIEEDKEKSIVHIINGLNKEYSGKCNNIPSEKNTFIGDALKNNEAFQKEFGKLHGSSYVVYRFLCNETHGNIGNVEERTISNGYFSINESTEDNAMAFTQCMILCLKDISYKFNKMFDD